MTFEYTVTKIAFIMKDKEKHLDKMGAAGWRLVWITHGKGFREFYWERRRGS